MTIALDAAPDATGLVGRERARQLSKGYTPEHDRRHGPLVLVDAVSALVDADERAWPWATRFTRVNAPLEQLVKAGALAAALTELIAAEIGTPDAAAAIGRERQRQLTAEPDSPENDPHATPDQLLDGVRAYIERRALHWPFAPTTFHLGLAHRSDDRRAELIRAGALASRTLTLILRNLERHLRATAA